MRLADLGALPLTLIASLIITIVLLAIRVFVMQRVQQRRQRENRQETERLKSLDAAYRSLAGSFTPASSDHRPQIEVPLSDIVLFGSLPQVEMATACVRRLQAGEPGDYEPLVQSLRIEPRTQLGLEPIPGHMKVPAAGPGRALRAGRPEGDGAGRGEGRGGGGGAGGSAAGAGGVSAGLIVADASIAQEQAP